MKRRLNSLLRKFDTIKAELMMRVAGFIFQNHESPLLQRLSKFAAWANLKRYSADTLDFLEHEDSIDIMDDSKYERE